MAYMNQERKTALSVNIKKALKKWGLKGSLKVHHHSTLVLTIRSGKIDFISEYNSARNFIDVGAAQGRSIQVNPHWYKEHFIGESLKALSEIIPLMYVGNHDNSDIQTDYFDVGWYVSVNIGEWNKPYITL